MGNQSRNGSFEWEGIGGNRPSAYVKGRLINEGKIISGNYPTYRLESGLAVVASREFSRSGSLELKHLMLLRYNGDVKKIIATSLSAVVSEEVWREFRETLEPWNCDIWHYRQPPHKDTNTHYSLREMRPLLKPNDHILL